MGDTAVYLFQPGETVVLTLDGSGGSFSSDVMKGSTFAVPRNAPSEGLKRVLHSEPAALQAMVPEADC